MASVLAVFAHPDDEVLGCGGALAKHAEKEERTHTVILCWRELVDEAKAAHDALGANSLHMARNADQLLDIRPLSDIVDDILHGANIHDSDDPDVIYTHHPADLNLDHALTARAVLTAFRPKPGEKPRTILACEVLSSTEWTFPPAFAPNWFVALTGEQLQRKVDALACYETEVQKWPHPRSALGVRNLAAYRGQSVGVEAAEAFQLLRHGPA